MLTIADKIKNEGIETGREIGRLQGREEAAFRLVRNGVEIETATRLIDLTPAQQERLRTRVCSSSPLDMQP